MTKDEALKLAMDWYGSGNQDPDEFERLILSIVAQPEQDLVEWGVDWGPDGNSVSIIKRLADGGIEVVGWEYAPHPPQRTWVGLTRIELIKCGVLPYGMSYELYEAIEQALKEKNK